MQVNATCSIHINSYTKGGGGLGKRLSLCMIVRDEEHLIQNCLNSVKHVVDEIIIVDTGSSDQTISICQSFGAKIIEVLWANSFAHARNYSLQEATGDWILWMDADEELDADNGIHVRDILTEENVHIAFVRLVNYVGDGDPTWEQSYIVGHHRLLRNHIGFQFRGAIHEQLNVREVLGNQFEVRGIPAVIYHYGYLDKIVKIRGKSERNLRLLEYEKEKLNYSPWVDYHIATELYRLQKYPEAFDAVNNSLRRFVENSQMPPSLCYKLKYDIILVSGSYSGAWPSIEKAIALYPDYVDLHFYKGIILYLKQQYTGALSAFQRCIELGEENINYLTLRGSGSFHAWYYIGKCHELLGDKEGAIQAFESSLHHHNTYSFAHEALGLLRSKSTGKDARRNK